MSNPTAFVQNLWNYCNIFRHGGLFYSVAAVERPLSADEELELVVSANLQRSTCLHSSILRRAFSGNLKNDIEQ